MNRLPHPLPIPSQQPRIPRLKLKRLSPLHLKSPPLPPNNKRPPPIFLNRVVEELGVDLGRAGEDGGVAAQDVRPGAEDAAELVVVAAGDGGVPARGHEGVGFGVEGRVEFYEGVVGRADVGVGFAAGDGGLDWFHGCFSCWWSGIVNWQV